MKTKPVVADVVITWLADGVKFRFLADEETTRKVVLLLQTNRVSKEKTG